MKAKLGKTSLQKLTGTMIDNMYMELEQKLAARTVLHVHNCLRPCLASAVKKKLLISNPADDAEAPVPGHTDDIIILNEHELATLVRGFEVIRWNISLTSPPVLALGAMRLLLCDGLISISTTTP